MIQQPSNISAEPEQLALIAQLQADLAGLQEQLIGMRGDHAALQRTMARAPKMHILGSVLVLVATALAWYLGGSDWLKFYVLPLYLGLMLVFWLGSWLLERWMRGKIIAIHKFVEQAQTQLAEASAGR